MGHPIPKVGIILGTGLGGIVEEIEIVATIDYADIPHFPTSTATSHRGRLVCGTLEGVPVVVMEGRFHMYEGYPLKQITLPVRVFQRAGCGIDDRQQRVRWTQPVLQRWRHHGDRRSNQFARR